MKIVQVNTSSPYEIRIQSGVLDQCGQLAAEVLHGRHCALVTDSNVGPLYAERVKNSLEEAGFTVCCFTFPAGEKSKNIHTYSALLEFLAENRLTRSDAIVALGGGVVGDLAGFAAATYLRGIDYIQVPTTLLSQVDSSVGGKTAIDLEHGKNLAGAFYQPKLVVMDPEVLHTLSDAAFADGMAEVIKYGCIWNKAFFLLLCGNPSRGQIMERIEMILYTCCDIKRQVVEEDEHDHGARMILNFGHTIGHAFELAGHYEKYTHGQAVAAGMCVAAQLGHGLGVSLCDDYDALMGLIDAFGLPTHIECDWNTIVEAIGLDKKGDGDEITLILLQKIGTAVPKKMKKELVLQNLEAVYGR